MNIRIPVSWLREYLKTDLATKTIANCLSASGPSVEKIEKRGNDYIFDVEVTSNRQDLYSVWGLAREAQAILTQENQPSELIPPKGLNLNLEPDCANPLSLEVIIKNPKLCPRFTAIIIDNVQIKPSPAIIRNRLEAAGIRAINNIVDISNYLMLELGQPMHTFDFDKIKGGKMVLRAAKSDEKITTLDDKTRKLPEGAIVIEDSQRLIDLCGIMGGANSQISRRTRRAILFIQAYDPQTIRKTTQALTFRTEAASRFEKGVDIEGILPALSRAVYLAKQTAGAKIASELIDIYKAQPKPKEITVNLEKLTQYLGIEIAPVKTIKILISLDFKAKLLENQIIAQPPSWRINDIQNDVDLIEEIARIYGYHRLPSKLPPGQISQSLDSELVPVIELKKALKYLGLTEAISYSIISKDLLKLSKVGKKDAVELANPLTETWQFMRPTILISLAQVVAQNQPLRSNLKLFEIAKTYHKQKNDLPKQDLMLAITLHDANFYQIKGVIENIFEILSRPVRFENLKEPSLFDTTNSAQIKIGETSIGILGFLNQSISDHFGIDNQIAAAEINLSAIYELPTTKLSYKPLPKYPPVIEDISAIFSKKASVGDMLSQTKGVGEPLVKKVEVIDIFEDEKIGQSKKSVTLRLTYQRSDRTPTQDEVTTIREKIINSLTKSFQVIIRR